MTRAVTIDGRPARLDYQWYRGDSFADTVTIKEGDPPAAVDVSARTYTAQLRRTRDSTDVVATMAIDTTNAATGIIGYSIDKATMALLDGPYYWDFQQEVGGVRRTLMGGEFTVSKDVTRST